MELSQAIRPFTLHPKPTLDLLSLLYVGAGGAIGSVARYALTVLVQQRLTTPFPVATLGINVSGSLLLGFLVRFMLASTTTSPEVRLLLTTGIWGGFTTFSTFSYETARLMEDGDHVRAGLYTLLSVGLSLAAMFAGFALARGVLDARR